MRKWGRRVAVWLMVVGVLAALGLAFWEPLTAEAGQAPAPRAYDTRIVRDTFGVPHIFGTSDADAAYGIAYAHAEDDFSTLQEVVAMTRGRAGALMGQEGAAIDYAFHLLGARATVDRDYAKQPDDVRALLDGYAAGLNHYAAKHPGEVRLARLFPVNGQDIATGFVLRSPFFFGLDPVLGALVKGEPTPRENAGATPDAPDPAALPPAGLGVGAPEPSAVSENGSNAFVLAPRRSAGGATRMIANSHQPWRGSVAWYELVVHSKAGWDFAGATFPGAPYPLLGHNKTLGWTNTVNRPDLIDIYKLSTNADSTQYRFDNKWLKLESRGVWLRVKLWGPFVLPVYKTLYKAVQGPVVVNKSGAYAIRYGGADQLRMVEQYYRLNRARDFAEWQRAMAIQGVPATNFLYADAAGNIAHFYNATFPNRQPGYDYAKVLPGDTSRDFAPGTLPWGRVPRNVNPGSGFLINANNTPYQAAGAGYELEPGDYSPLLGIETDTTNRGTRAIELMGADASISEAELMAIKFDTVVSRNSWAARWFAQLMAVDPKGDAQLAAAVALLKRWDWSFNGRNPAQALAGIVFRVGNRWHYPRRPEADPRTELAKAAAYLQQHFGRLDPPLGSVLRLRQGKVDLPLDGGADVLRAASNWDEAPDGRLVVKHGDSFIMAVAWDRAGRVSSQSVQPFGAATTRPNSPHYADQAALFAAHRFKPVWFDRAELTKHSERTYRP